jgi:hypothetical protein
MPWLCSERGLILQPNSAVRGRRRTYSRVRENAIWCEHTVGERARSYRVWLWQRASATERATLLHESAGYPEYHKYALWQLGAAELVHFPRALGAGCGWRRWWRIELVINSVAEAGRTLTASQPRSAIARLTNILARPRRHTAGLCTATFRDCTLGAIVLTVSGCLRAAGGALRRALSSTIAQIARSPMSGARACLCARLCA